MLKDNTIKFITDLEFARVQKHLRQRVYKSSRNHAEYKVLNYLMYQQMFDKEAELVAITSYLYSNDRMKNLK